MLQPLVLALALASVPEVAIEINSESGISATGELIAVYDNRLAEEVLGDLQEHGVTASILRGEVARPGTRLAVRLNHHAIPAAWVKQGHADAFYGFALGIAQSNPDQATTISCTRLVGTALREAGEIPSLYKSFKMPGLDQPLLDEALGIHFAKGDEELLHRNGAVMNLEVGIVSSQGESRRLANPVVVAGIADAIASGIHECFQPGEAEEDEADDFIDKDMFK